MKRKPKIVKWAANTRVPCICQVRTAKMMYDGVCIGTISEEQNDAGEFDWVIRPDYDALDKHPISITGINLDLHLDEYIRTYVPEFVDRRTLPDNRDRLFEELSEVGLTWNDRFEFMIRHHGICGGSQITVERMSDEEQQKYLDYVKDLQSKEC